MLYKTSGRTCDWQTAYVSRGDQANVVHVIRYEGNKIFAFFFWLCFCSFLLFQALSIKQTAQNSISQSQIPICFQTLIMHTKIEIWRNCKSTLWQLETTNNTLPFFFFSNMTSMVSKTNDQWKWERHVGILLCLDRRGHNTFPIYLQLTGSYLL